MNYIISLFHLLSPLLLSLFIYNGTDYRESFPDESFFDILAFSCLLVAIFFGWFFSDKISLRRTGRSFRTKSGVKFNEYEESRIKAPEMGELSSYIFFIHVGVFMTKIISFFL